MENTGSPARQVLNSYARSIVYDPTVIIISDDISEVVTNCSRVIVMKEGRIVEAGDARSIIDTPREAYTKELVRAILG